MIKKVVKVALIADALFTHNQPFPVDQVADVIIDFIPGGKIAVLLYPPLRTEVSQLIRLGVEKCVGKSYFTVKDVLIQMIENQPKVCANRNYMSDQSLL